MSLVVYTICCLFGVLEWHLWVGLLTPFVDMLILFIYGVLTQKN